MVEFLRIVIVKSIRELGKFVLVSPGLAGIHGNGRQTKSRIEFLVADRTRTSFWFVPDLVFDIVGRRSYEWLA